MSRLTNQTGKGRKGVDTEAAQWFAGILSQIQPTEQPSHPFNLFRQKASQQVQQRLAAGNLPNRRQEVWKYTYLSGLQENLFRKIDSSLADDNSAQASQKNTQLAKAKATETSHATKERDISQRLSEGWSGADSYRVVLVDGEFNPGLSQLEGLPENCFIGDFSQAMQDGVDILQQYLGQAVLNAEGDYRSIFTLLNEVDLSHGLLIYIDDQIQLSHPIEVIHMSGGTQDVQLIQPRHLFVLAKGAKAQLIERFESRGDAVHFNNYVTEVILEPHAVLDHIQLQMLHLNAYYINHLALKLESDSEYTGNYVAMGANLARTELGSYLQQRGAKCHLNGLYLVTAKQVIDFHLDIQHISPNCSSETHFKGVMMSPGRAVFDGRILLKKGAQKSQAHLTAHHLMLSRKAEVDSKPQLIILADDVQCSHGSTVGQLDPLAIFYLRSRGFSEAAARQTLVRGFIQEVLSRINNDNLLAHLETQITRGIQAGVEW